MNTHSLALIMILVFNNVVTNQLLFISYGINVN